MHSLQVDQPELQAHHHLRSHQEWRGRRVGFCPRTLPVYRPVQREGDAARRTGLLYQSPSSQHVSQNEAKKSLALYDIFYCAPPTSLLEWSLDPKSGIRRQDAQTVFASVARNPLGQTMVFDFALKNWERIVKAYVTIITGFSPFTGRLPASKAIYYCCCCFCLQTGSLVCTFLAGSSIRLP